MKRSTFMRDRQRPLVKLYRETPQAAWVTDRAATHSDVSDPLHGSVTLNGQRTLPFSLHTAVGGQSDEPVPGDLLCGALASCLDSTLRVVAQRMGVELARVEISAQAEVDVRGTLMVSPDVPVAFQRMSVHAVVAAANESDAESIPGLLQFAETACVVLQTLRRALPVTVTLDAPDQETHHVA